MVKRGYRQNTAAAGAPTYPRLPQIQFWRASKVPADVAEHAHRCLFFFSSTLLGLTGTRRTRGLRGPPFLTTWWVGVCPPKIYKIYVLPPRDHPFPPCYHPFPLRDHPSLHLTEIIPLYDHLWQHQKQVQTHLHVTVQQPEGRTTGSCEKSRSISSGNSTRRTREYLKSNVLLYQNIPVQIFAN